MARPPRWPSPKRPPQASGPLLVIAQNSREAEALSEEIRFFAGPGLNVRVFPDLETLPYDSFSAHPDITSARLATLAELPRARHGVWLVAIDTLLQRLAPRSYIEAYSLKVHRQRNARPRGAARAIGDGRLCRGHASRGARRIRGPRLADRCIPHGLGHALPHRPAGSGRRQHSALRSGHAALARQAGPHSAAAGARNPVEPGGGARVPAPLSAALHRRSCRSRRSTATSAPAWRPAASNSSCRCSSSAPRICSSICRPTASWWTSTMPPQEPRNSGTASSSAMNSCGTTATGRSWIPRKSICRPANSCRHCSPWPKVRAAHLSNGRPRRRELSQNFPTRRRPRCASTRAPSSRRRNWCRISTPPVRASCSPPNRPAAAN